MWPFNNSLKQQLKQQDGIKKYRRWLKKWLLGGAKTYAAVGLALILLGVLLALRFNFLPLTEPVTNENNNPKPSVTEEVQTEPTNTPTAKEPPIDLNQLVMPVDGEILLDFNQPYYSETYQDYRFSEGVRFNAAEGRQVKAALAGKILSAELDPYNGFTVIIDHGQGYQSKYVGLSNLQVTAGQKVDKGDILGSSDTPINFILTHNGQAIDPKYQ